MADDDNLLITRKNATSTQDFTQLQKLIMLDLKNYPYQIANRFIGKYRREDIARYLAVPELFYNQLQLRYISKYLFNVSSHYRSLINYFSMLLNFDYIIEPYALDIDKVDNVKFKKAYKKAVDLVESMNIKHEFQKLMTVAYRDDAYYGYVHMSKDSFFIQPLNPDYCKISSIVDGVYNFAFDFNYFNAYPNRLYMFPTEFQDKHKEYIKDGVRWKELSTENTICIKINEDLDYCIPPFVGIFGNLLDIQDFKDLERQRQEIGNYKLLVQKIPLRPNSVNNNDYAITAPHVSVYHNNISQALPEQVALLTSPMDIEPINFERDHPDINKVEEATAQFWDAAGVSSLLFSGASDGASGSISMGNSIKTDEVRSLVVGRQLERWLNRFLKNFNGNQYKFRVRILESTIFNRNDLFNRALQAASYGSPGAKSMLVALQGLEPSTMTSMAFLENDVLELHNNMIPLSSSHTQSGSGASGGSGSSNGGGRPEKPESELSDEGAKTKDGLKNQNGK